MSSFSVLVNIRGSLIRCGLGLRCSNSRLWHSSVQLDAKSNHTTGPANLHLSEDDKTDNKTPVEPFMKRNMKKAGQMRNKTAKFTTAEFPKARNVNINTKLGDHKIPETELLDKAPSKASNTSNIMSEDYGYFKSLVGKALVLPESVTLKTNKTETVNQSQSSSLEVLQTSESPSSEGDQVTNENLMVRGQNLVPSSKPVLPKKASSLAAYVNESETLTNIVQLGVDLSRFEKNLEAANHLLKANFEKEIKPYIVFLHRNGVADSDLGLCITKNPSIFQIPYDDLEVRINYLRSKKFSAESIGRIITKSPAILSLTTKQIDGHMGFLQKNFSLSGDEVRLVVTRHPKIAIWDQRSILDMKMTYTDFLGFSNEEAKELLLNDPKLYLAGKYAVMKRFDYIHNKIGFSHQTIAQWPSVLHTRLTIVKPRHLFLKLMGRDQFDPTKENYVSLKGLALGRDIEFCEKFAKCSVDEYNNFLKTL